MVAILVPENNPKSHFGHFIHLISDMPGLISFQLGMLIGHVGLLMHIIFCVISFKMADWQPFCFLFIHALGWFFNTIYFKVVTENKHDNIHVHMKCFSDSITLFTK